MNTRTRGYLITILASIAWGFSGVCSEFLMKDYSANPYWLTAVRVLLAAPTTMGFLLLKTEVSPTCTEASCETVVPTCRWSFIRFSDLQVAN